MTPLGGFLKKILGGTSTPAPTPVAAPPGGSRLRTTAPDDDRGAPDDGEHSGRRRGSRGGRGRGNSAADAPGAQATPSSEAPAPSTRGRGRGRGTSDAPAASTEARSYTWSARPSGDSNETEEQARQRREQASRQRRGRTPSFRPYRENLDAPLPEDIAFRSGAEGGDRSILPARRRRGTGLRDTERVLVAGARSLSGWSRPIGGSDDLTVASLQAEAPEGTTAAPARRSRTARETDPAIVLDGDDELHDATADDADTDDAETTEDGAPRRRRRGRRGGRGRRRPGTPLEGELDENGEPRGDLIDTRTGGDLDGDLDEEPDDEAEDEDEESSYAAYDLSDADEFEEPEADLDLSDDEQASQADDKREAAPSGPVRREARKPRAQATVDAAEFPQAFADLGVGEITLQTLA
ncbi:MAG: hypothetical protein DWI58_08535, partial [Chloroflexi bacterium]